ncbi:MAG TPA: hypothetical protein VMS60_12425 [Solirubrobacterales bacterium]|nr:hypothetical protein [Solirubrobacterales bacterium]
MGGKLSIGDALREVAINYWRHARVLLPLGFVVALLAGLVVEVGAGLWGTIVFLVLTPALWTLYEGVVVNLVRARREGRPAPPVRDLLRATWAVAPPLIGVGLLYSVGTTVGIALLIIPGLILVTLWAVVVPAVAIEGREVVAAFRRSQALTRESEWRVFVVILVTVVIDFGPVFFFRDFADASLPLAVLLGTVLAPIEGLVAAALYYRLLEVEPA